MYMCQTVSPTVTYSLCQHIYFCSYFIQDWYQLGGCDTCTAHIGSIK